jgi:serine/threonine-protein phosphatase 2A regulatory subunit B'
MTFSFPYLATPKDQREELFLKKINQCKVLFDFTKTLHEVDQKEIKRETLLELVEYVLTEKNALTPASYKDITEMVSTTLLIHFERIQIFQGN